MSPEQASGLPADFRSDQFSFGAILYELSTGRRAFQRGTPVETLTAIIREEPEPIGQSSPKTPLPLRWIIERCLEKDPEERYESTKDLARDLARLRRHLPETTSSGDGSFVIPDVVIGPYKVTAKAEGFKTFVEDAIEVRVDENRRIAIRMEMGSITERIIVTAEVAQVETRTGTISEVVDSARHGDEQPQRPVPERHAQGTPAGLDRGRPHPNLGPQPCRFR
jgi:serine/threonine protein kinase